VQPFLDQSKVIAACRKHGISITAYCPLARGKVPGDATLGGIGKQHGKTAAQAALRWLVQQGIAVIPRSSKPERLAENMAVFDFALSDAEMAEIGRLKRPDSRVVDPPHAPKWDE
jgi:2,5-diketo-D-gluconate reductase B